MLFRPAMRCEIFTDPIYHAERPLEFDPADVVYLRERTLRLFLRGKYDVTEIRFKNGTRHFLRGHIAAQIEAERQQSNTDGQDG